MNVLMLISFTKILFIITITNYFKFVYSDEINLNNTNLCMVNLSVSYLSEKIEYTGISLSDNYNNNVEGQLIYAKSYSHYKQNFLNKILNKSDTDSKGCSEYITENLPNGFVAIVDESECSIEQQVENATKNNALALLIIQKDLNSLLNIIKITKYPIAVVLISSELGKKLTALLEENDAFVSLKFNLCQSETVNDTDLDDNRLSIGSITIIIIGNLTLIMIIIGMCVIFYFIQKTRLVEERDRYNRMIEKFTKQAILKMKCQKLKETDKEIIGNEVCVICLEDYKLNDMIRKLPCMHYFHKDEIDHWMYENKSCPICKIDILKEYGLHISRQNSIFHQVFRRLRIIHSPDEVNEVILSQLNNRRETFPSIHSNIPRQSIFSITTENSILPVNNLEQRKSVFDEFKRLHMKSFSTDAIEDFDNDENGQLETRRLTFFGENTTVNNKKTKEHANLNKIQIIIQDDENHVHSQSSSAPSNLMSKPTISRIDTVLNDENDSNENMISSKTGVKFT